MEHACSMLPRPIIQTTGEVLKPGQNICLVTGLVTGLVVVHRAVYDHSALLKTVFLLVRSGLVAGKA